MKVTVVGAGYVGLVTAACLAELGNQVVGVDHDHVRVALLQAAGVPIYEPGLDELVQRNLQAGRLSFTTGMPQAVAQADVIFIAVGTPPQEDGSADLQHVLDVARQIGMHMRGFKVVVNKSTVPVGTGIRVQAAIEAELNKRGLQSLAFAVVSNPEFLKEGAAIDDFMRPDRIVVGLPDDPAGEQARVLMTRLYAPFNRHHERTVWMDVPSAELTKYAANAMLATRISFMNEMANLADRVGADIDAVRRGVGADMRIGHSFLYAGTGYGGSCFPKDTRALAHTAAQHGLKLQVVEAVENVNRAQKLRLVQHVLQRFGTDLRGRRFAIWGLAFKPNTNDMREAPSRTVIRELLARGAELTVHDPVAMEEARRALGADLRDTVNALDRLHFAETPMQALEGADALLVLTEWKCFQNPDFPAMRACMRHPVVLDGRNLYDPMQMEELGFVYQGIGRRNALACMTPGVPAASQPARDKAQQLAL
ncbi:UDP-glucose/GDP-mannose dehydrogenase family protein [Hydrogenophaga aquatica]